MARRRRGPAMSRRKKSSGKAHRALPQTQDRVSSAIKTYRGEPFKPESGGDRG